MRRPRRVALACSALALVLSNCSPASGTAEGTGADAPAAPTATPAPAAPAAGPEPYSPYKETRELMSTVMGITVLDTPEPEARRAVDAAFRAMVELEAVLSEWRPDSEISRINQAAGLAPVKVGPHTLAVVKAGLEVSRWSDGAFDLSWAVLRGMYSFQPGEERIPSAAEIQAKLPLIRHQDIVLDEAAQTVQLKRKGMLIGTGGITKGYALDQAGAVLQRAGIRNYMLFGGGQIQLGGRKNGRPWRVGIQHPRKPDYFAMLEAESGSVSTSGDYEHSFEKDGQRWHHIVDTKTGRPVQHTASVTVIADSGMYADALSTAVFVLGAKRAMELLPSAPGHPEVVIVEPDLTLHRSAGLATRLVMKTAVKDGKLAD
jgi:thiamine biosynthesis lipoprotein